VACARALIARLLVTLRQYIANLSAWNGKFVIRTFVHVVCIMSGHSRHDLFDDSRLYAGSASLIVPRSPVRLKALSERISATNIDCRDHEGPESHCITVRRSRAAAFARLSPTRRQRRRGTSLTVVAAQTSPGFEDQRRPFAPLASAGNRPDAGLNIFQLVRRLRPDALCRDLAAADGHPGGAAVQ
jgi:hypothetical protein